MLQFGFYLARIRVNTQNIFSDGGTREGIE